MFKFYKTWKYRLQNTKCFKRITANYNGFVKGLYKVLRHKQNILAKVSTSCQISICHFICPNVVCQTNRSCCTIKIQTDNMFLSPSKCMGKPGQHELGMMLQFYNCTCSSVFTLYTSSFMCRCWNKDMFMNSTSVLFSVSPTGITIT